MHLNKVNKYNTQCIRWGKKELSTVKIGSSVLNSQRRLHWEGGI